MNPMPNKAKTIATHYKYLDNIRNRNASSNQITIVFSKMDTISQGKMRDKLFQALAEYCAIYRETMLEETKEYIKKLKRQVMSDQVTIDYDKFENYEIAKQFRETVQFVCIKRCREIYLSMTMNGVF